MRNIILVLTNNWQLSALCRPFGRNFLIFENIAAGNNCVCTEQFKYPCELTIKTRFYRYDFILKNKKKKYFRFFKIRNN